MMVGADDDEGGDEIIQFSLSNHQIIKPTNHQIIIIIRIIIKSWSYLWIINNWCNDQVDADDQHNHRDDNRALQIIWWRWWWWWWWWLWWWCWPYKALEALALYSGVQEAQPLPPHRRSTLWSWKSIKFWSRNRISPLEKNEWFRIRKRNKIQKSTFLELMGMRI